MKSTTQILNKIKQAKSYTPTETRLNADLSIFLKNELASVNLKQMFIMLDIDVTNGYKYIRGDRQMSRDQLLKVLIYLEYDLEQIQAVLKQYEFPILYAKNERDSALIYAIYNKYDYAQVKRYLQQHKQMGL